MTMKNKVKHFIQYWVLDPVFGAASFCVHFSLRYVPMPVNSLGGAIVGRFVFKTHLRKKAQRARRTLSILKPDLSSKEIDQLLDKMWVNIGKSMCEYSILDKLWDKGRLEIDDTQIQRAIESGKPIIFTAAHLGNWEAQASYIHAKKIPLMAMYKPVRNRFSAKIADIARKRMDILTVPTDLHAMRKMYKHLQNGGAIWLPIDDYKRGQVHFPRFGRPLALKGTNASHIAKMAKRFDAAVIPVQIIRKDTLSPSFKVIGHPPRYLTDKSDEGVLTFISELDKLVESWIMERPEQWFMLHELRLEE
jgi:KDO2-lipid IV(A) lauroyltransferase